MARITTSHAVADRNRRFASELAGIGMIPEARGGMASELMTRTRPLPRRPSSQDTSRQDSSKHRASGAGGRRGQEIAEATDSLDDVDVELLADAADEDLDGVGVAVEVLVVEMLDQLGAGHNASRMVHQVGQKPILVRRHLDGITRHADPSGPGIERDGAAAQLALGVAGGAAQQRADPRQHLLQVERLCDIVVGTCIEALDLVAPAVARGEDQDRHGAAVAPPGFQHRDAVLLRQADVEHHGIVGLVVTEKMPLLAIEGAIDDIAGVGQRLGKLAIEIGVVLDDEQAHASSPKLGRMNTCTDEQFRRELNMNTGNRPRYFLVISDLLAVNALRPPGHRTNEPTAWRAQCAALRSESEGANRPIDLPIRAGRTRTK